MVVPDAPAATTNPRWRRLALLLAVSSLVIVGDQVTKRMVDARLRTRTVEVMPGFDLRYARNPGAAWGLMADVRETYRKPFFIVVSILVMGFIVFTYARSGRDQARLRLALALVLGGALGNFIDRMEYGYVIDFIDWHAHIFGRLRHWPTFNVADVGITVGVLLLALDLFPRREAAATEVAAGEATAAPPPVPPSPPAPGEPPGEAPAPPLAP